MGVDSKTIGVFIWKCVRFSINVSYRFAAKHPIASCVVLFLFLLYVFFPFVFTILIYCSPIIICATVYIRIWRPSRTQIKLENGKKENNGESTSSKGVEGDRTGKFYIKQKSVRRNARMKVEVIGKGWESSQTSEDEKNKVILTTLYNDLLGRTPRFDDSPKNLTLEKEENQTSSNLDTAPASALLLCENLEDYGTAAETEIENNADVDDVVEKERQKDRSKEVKETEKDQKNQMDLGLSEMERNQRLESLIARRRSRRSFKFAAEKKFVDTEMGDIPIPPISVTKNKFFDHLKCTDSEGLQWPGSAPSVMLPGRNPFDLPYDAHEEKPDLLGDSFQQEFSVANPKDKLLCRHESFLRVPYILEAKQDQCDPTPDWHSYNRAAKQRENVNKTEVGETSTRPNLGEDNPQDQTDSTDESDEESEEDTTYDAQSRLGNRTEAQTETDSIMNNDSESGSSSYSPSENEQAQGKGGLTGRRRKFHSLNSLTSIYGKSLIGPGNFMFESGSYINDRRKMEENPYYTGKKMICHTPTYSIASDLQVEFSEIGSPPSSDDGGSFTFDGDFGIINELKPIKEDEVKEEESTLLEEPGDRSSPVTSLLKNQDGAVHNPAGYLPVEFTFAMAGESSVPPNQLVALTERVDSDSVSKLTEEPEKLIGLKDTRSYSNPVQRIDNLESLQSNEDIDETTISGVKHILDSAISPESVLLETSPIEQEDKADINKQAQVSLHDLNGVSVHEANDKMEELADSLGNSPEEANTIQNSLDSDSNLAAVIGFRGQAEGSVEHSASVNSLTVQVGTPTTDAEAKEVAFSLGNSPKEANTSCYIEENLIPPISKVKDDTIQDSLDPDSNLDTVIDIRSQAEPSMEHSASLSSLTVQVGTPTTDAKAKELVDSLGNAPEEANTSCYVEENLNPANLKVKDDTIQNSSDLDSNLDAVIDIRGQTEPSMEHSASLNSLKVHVGTPTTDAEARDPLFEDISDKENLKHLRVGENEHPSGQDPLLSDSEATNFSVEENEVT